MRGAWAVAVACAVVVMAGAYSCGPVEASNDAATPEQRIQAATVTLAGRCAGVVAEDGWHVVTAAHCVNEGDAELPLTFQTGDDAVADVSEVDRIADVAVLTLRSAAPVEGLAFADGMPPPGSAAYFAGRFDRGATLQQVEIVKWGHCPSLPGVPEALFTSLHGAPGDSGAPVVDMQLRVVGLVHGGARCSVAAPTTEVGELLRSLGAATKR